MKQVMSAASRCLAVCLLMSFAVSCTKEKVTADDLHLENTVEMNITASAGLPSPAPNKAYVDTADSRKVKWEPNDNININGTLMPIAERSNNNTTGLFYGTAHAITSGSNSVLWAVYPTSLAAQYSGSLPSCYTSSSLTVDFPATQEYYKNQPALKGYANMAGYASVPNSTATTARVNFQMHNLGSVLQLYLKTGSGLSGANSQITKIIFSTTSDKALAGKFTVSNSSNPTVAPVSGQTTNMLTVNLHDGQGHDYIDVSGGANIFVALPPFNGTLVMTICRQADSKVTTRMINSNLVRNNLYKSSITDMTFNETYYFRAASNKKVVFSPGNLQWTAAGTHDYASGQWNGTDVSSGGKGTWRFAANQWDAIGSDNRKIDENYTAGYIDLFGWGTGGWHSGNDPLNLHYQPWETSTSTYVNTTYNGQTVINKYGYGPSSHNVQPLTGGSSGYDWAWFNAIKNPKTNSTDSPRTWRTPADTHWTYFLSTRITGSIVNNTPIARWTLAKIGVVSSDGNNFVGSNSKTGLILFPDNGGIFDMAGNGTWGAINAKGTAFTRVAYNDWRKWEQQGAVFLPLTGRRQQNSVDVTYQGHYWSTTSCHEQSTGTVYDKAKRIWFGHDSDNENSPVFNISSRDIERYYGCAVRPIKDL